MSMKVRYDIEKEDDFHDDRSDGKKNKNKYMIM